MTDEVSHAEWSDAQMDQKISRHLIFMVLCIKAQHMVPNEEKRRNLALQTTYVHLFLYCIN